MNLCDNFYSHLPELLLAQNYSHMWKIWRRSSHFSFYQITFLKNNIAWRFFSFLSHTFFGLHILLHTFTLFYKDVFFYSFKMWPFWPLKKRSNFDFKLLDTSYLSWEFFLVNISHKKRILTAQIHQWPHYELIFSISLEFRIWG